MCKTDLSKPVKQEVYSTAILAPVVFPVVACEKHSNLFVNLNKNKFFYVGPALKRTTQKKR
jgi:hypothetical protein